MKCFEIHRKVMFANPQPHVMGVNSLNVFGREVHEISRCAQKTHGCHPTPHEGEINLLK